MACIFGLLVALLGLAEPAAAVAQASAPACLIYGYDSIHACALGDADTTTERGPPAAYDHAAAHDAVGRWSHGASAYPTTTTTPAITSYDYTATLAQDATVADTAERGPQVGAGRPSSRTRAGVAAKTGTAGADDVLNGVRLRAQLTGQEISGGHAFGKHVVQGGEFPGITTRAQFAAHIEDVVTNGVMRPLSSGRSAYWSNGTVVIRNPNAIDGGTAFRPTNGYDYFLNLH